MHPDVLLYMKKAGSWSEGEYLMHADSGRIRYVLYGD